MNEKELRAIYNCLNNAQGTIEVLACENYPHTDFVDKELGDMFHALNSMCISIHDKIKALKKGEIYHGGN